MGLNLVYLVPDETGGMETYARELIPALVSEAPGIRLTAFVNRVAASERHAPWNALIPSVTVDVDARRRSEWVRGEQQLVPRLARRSGVHLLHSLASTAPLWGRFRRVVTIHDLIYRIHPETHGRIRAAGMSTLVPLAARRSHRVIVPSKATRNDVTRLIGVTPEKIHVVPQGVRLEDVEAVPEIEMRRALSLGDRPVVLTASAKRPHKNLARLLEALASIDADRRPVIALPGYPTPYEADLRRHAAVLGLTDDVRFLGWVPPAELEALYACASAFVFPSLYEGFGLPVLEAMARGVPVACSARGSLAEVAGNAALVFDPESVEAIAQALVEILTDDRGNDRRRTLGIDRAARFTWAATARGTLDVYARAIAG